MNSISLPWHWLLPSQIMASKVLPQVFSHLHFPYLPLSVRLLWKLRIRIENLVYKLSLLSDQMENWITTVIVVVVVVLCFFFCFNFLLWRIGGWVVQALFITPRSSNQWPPKKLGLSTFPSPRSSSLNLNRLSTSRFSSNSFGFHFRPIVVSPKRFFIVRAEADNEGELGADENTEEEETVSETESEVKLDAEDEAKPPRKPRVKLGDIMGVFSLCSCVILLECSLCLLTSRRKENKR